MLKNFILETCNAPGTSSTINLAGAATGRMTFAQGFSTGKPVYYFMDDGVQAEWGKGTFTTGSPNTLSRDTVIGNTAGTLSRLNFAGTVRVYNDVPGERLIFADASLATTLPGDLVAHSVNGGPLAGFRNRIHNGNFGVNQRSIASGTARTSGQFVFDRWKAGASGATCTFTSTPPSTIVTITAASIIQTVEGVDFEGGTYTLSWTGTAQGRVNGGSFGSSPLTTASLASGTNLTIEFNTGSVSKVQFEPGSTATPFEWRPHNVELLLCQRFYVSSDTFNIGGAAVSGSAITLLNLYFFPTAMRATPTVTYSVTGGSGYNTTTNPPTTATVSQTGFSGQLTSLAANNAYVASSSYIATAEI